MRCILAYLTTSLRVEARFVIGLSISHLHLLLHKFLNLIKKMTMLYHDPPEFHFSRWNGLPIVISGYIPYHGRSSKKRFLITFWNYQKPPKSSSNWLISSLYPKQTIARCRAKIVTGADWATMATCWIISYSTSYISPHMIILDLLWLVHWI